MSDKTSKLRKYIAYSESTKNDKIIEAHNIKEALSIAKMNFGKDVKVQVYDEDDEDIWNDAMFNLLKKD